MNYKKLQDKINDLRDTILSNADYKKVSEVIAQIEDYYKEKIESLNNKITELKTTLNDPLKRYWLE